MTGGFVCRWHLYYEIAMKNATKGNYNNNNINNNIIKNNDSSDNSSSLAMDIPFHSFGVELKF